MIGPQSYAKKHINGQALTPKEGGKLGKGNNQNKQQQQQQTKTVVETIAKSNSNKGPFAIIVKNLLTRKQIVTRK